MKTSINKWTIDEVKKKDGTWINLGDGERVRIRPGGGLKNPEQVAYLLAGLKERGFNNPDEAPDSLVDEILNESIAHHVLLDWQGFTNADGSEMEPSIENKIMMLEKELFRDRVLKEVQNADNFLVAETEEMVKN